MLVFTSTRQYRRSRETFRDLYPLEQTGSRIAQVQTEITKSGLCQQIDTYRIDIHVFAYSLLFPPLMWVNDFTPWRISNSGPMLKKSLLLLPSLCCHSNVIGIRKKKWRSRLLL